MVDLLFWAETVNEIRRQNPETTLETLIPDFKAKKRYSKNN